MELPSTPAEIVARIHHLTMAPSIDGSPGDLHGVERSRLLEALPWKEAQQFFKPGTPHTEESWENGERTPNSESVLAQIKDYLAFAWGKANLRRGDSAIRSLSHFRGLIWLLGPEHDDLYGWIETPDYFEFYGKPALVRVSDLVSYDWRCMLDENGDPRPGRDDDRWCYVPDIDEENPPSALTADQALGQ